MFSLNGCPVTGQIKIGESLRTIVFFPAGDEEIASTRLRVYSILPFLQDCRPTDFQEIRNIPNLDATILWFQKKLSEEHLRLARELSTKGPIIVYDCDESGAALTGWAQPHLVFEMLHLSDYIIVDTPERMDWIKGGFSAAKIHVIENQIDYGFPKETNDQAKHGDSAKRLRLLWFGNPMSLSSLRESADALGKLDKYKLVLCGVTPDDALQMLPGCDAEIHPWSRNTILKIIQSCDLSILSHEGNPSDSRKSGHKMVTSICHGLPAIVSSTPDYSRIAKFAGVQDFVYEDPVQLCRILDYASDARVRDLYLQVARPRLMEKYYPGSFAKNTLGFIEKISSIHRNGFRIYKSLQRVRFSKIATKSLRLFGKTYWRRLQS